MGVLASNWNVTGRVYGGALLLLLASCSQAEAPSSPGAPDSGESTADAGESGPDAAAQPQSLFYASPTGGGTVCTKAAPCSLAGAQALVRTVNGNMTGDIAVVLLGGTYDIHQAENTLRLTSADSGTNGHFVIWQASPGEAPLLSGAFRGLVFTDHVGPHGRYAAAGLPAGVMTRDLWVQGKRATRSRGHLDPVGWTLDATGISTGSDDLSASPSQNEIEIVGFHQWKQFRCPVQSISGNRITMQNPCWGNSYDPVPNNPGDPSGCHPGWGFAAVSWVENELDQTDSPGEFYYSATSGSLIYDYRAGEIIDSVNHDGALLATNESLVTLAGTHHVRFDSIRFEHTTWDLPMTGSGYVEMQAGMHWEGGTGEHCNGAELRAVPGMVSMSGVHDVEFVNDVFAHSGASALSADHSSHDVRIVGNHFEDIAAASVIVDSTTMPSFGFSISDNFMRDSAVTYMSATAISMGIHANTSIVGNEIAGASYSGIALGWDWGYGAPQPGNHIDANRVSGTMRTVLWDGGGIYDNQVNSGASVGYNYVSDSGHLNPTMWAIYMDGATGVDVNHNLVAIDGSVSLMGWLSMSNGLNNSVTDNFSYPSTGFICRPPPSDTAASCLSSCGSGGVCSSGYTCDPTMAVCVPSDGVTCFDCQTVTRSNNLFYPTALPPWAVAIDPGDYTSAGCRDRSCAGISAARIGIRSVSP
jgi:hypothetical protein